MLRRGGYGTGGYGQGPYGGGGAEIFSEPLNYYLNLITSQYQNSEKFLSLVLICLQKFDDITNLLYTFDVQLDIDNAVGVQLDILGQIVGVGRRVNFQPSSGIDPVLDDRTFRLLLRATIARNHWNGQVRSMEPIWTALFPGGRIIVQDNQDMSVTVILSGSFDSIIQDLITHDYIVPRAEGVLMNYVFGTLPLLGFDRDDLYVAGLDKGHFA